MTTATGDFPPLYDYFTPAPFPAAGASVGVSGGGEEHSVTFTIDASAPNACIRVDPSGNAYGPFVAVGTGLWSSVAAFTISRNPGKITASIEGDPGPVKVSGTINYEITATCNQTPNPGTFTVAAQAPPGTTIISVSGSGQSGGTVAYWQIPSGNTAMETFSVQVLDSAKPPYLTASASASATFGDQAATDSSSFKTKFVKGTEVKGVIRDVILNFPAETNVNDRMPLGGAHVALQDSGGNTVAQMDTSYDGAYDLDSGAPGDYTLMATKAADSYHTGDAQVTKGGATVTQQYDVNISGTSDEPVTQDVYLPCSLVSLTAQDLYNLNHLTYEYAGFIPATSNFDTTKVEAAVDALLADTSQQFTGVYTGSGKRDGFNALIRMDTFMGLLETRWKENAQLGDDFGKIVSLAIMVDLIKRLYGKDGYLSTGQNFAKTTDNGLFLEAAKISVLTLGVGNRLPAFLNQFPISSQWKSFIIEFVAKAVRFGGDALINNVVGANTGKGQEDLVFEIGFQAMRAALFSNYNIEFMQGANPQDPTSPSAQLDLNTAAGLFSNKVYSDDTDQTLAFLANYDSLITNRDKEIHSITSDALTYKSYVRAVQGVNAKLGKTALAGKVGSWLTSTFSEVAPEIGAKVLPALEAGMNAAVITAYTVGIGVNVLNLVFISDDVQLEQSMAFSGPIPDAKPYQIPNPANLLDYFSASPQLVRGDEMAAAGVMSALSGTPLPAPVSDYLSVIQQVQTAVKANDATGYANLVPSLASANQGLMAYLAPLSAGADILLQSGTSVPAAAETASQAFSADQYQLWGQISLLYGSLLIWETDGDSAGQRLVLEVITPVISSLNEIGPVSVSMQAALSGLTLPGQIEISGGGVGTSAIAPNTQFSVIYTFTNVGGTTSPEGVAEIFSQPGITVVSAPEQDIPPLAAGESVQLGWVLQSGSFSDYAYGSYQVEASTPGGYSDTYQDFFLVSPP